MLTDWDRYYEAKKLRDSGLTYKLIGDKLGVCGNRARQMVIRAERREEKIQYLREHPEETPWYHSLSEGAMMEANRLGIYGSSPEEFNEWCSDLLKIKRGRVVPPKGLARRIYVKTVSINTVNEIRKALGAQPLIVHDRTPTKNEITRAINLLKKAGYKVTK